MTLMQTHPTATLSDATLALIEQRVLAGERLHRIGFDHHLTSAEVIDLMTLRGITIPAASLASPETRNEIIAERAEKGEDLTAIGKDYDMSRERVRQIVAKTSTMSNTDIREARRRYREVIRDCVEADRMQAIRETAATHPDATISTLAELTGESTSLVRESLDWTERERRADQQVYASVPEDEVLAEIRRVAALPGGDPLTGGYYDEHRSGGVSHARLLQKYGTWTAACAAAGVTPRQPNPGRTYTRNWTEAEMVQWVWDYLSVAENPSYARFEIWLREEDGAPSAQTIRNTVGSWVEMKRRAIETHAGSIN